MMNIKYIVLFIMFPVAAVLFGGCDNNTVGMPEKLSETTAVTSAFTDKTASAAVTAAAAVSSASAVTSGKTTENPEAVENKIIEPRDTINGIPLYIELGYNTEQSSPETRNVYTLIGLDNLYSNSETITVSYEGRMMDIRSYEIYYEDWDNESYYWLGRKIFDIWFPSSWDSGFLMYYSAYLTEYSPIRVLVLTDESGNANSYMLNKNKDGTLKVEKVDIHKQKRGNDGVKHTLAGKEEITVKFYNAGDLNEYYEDGKLNYELMPYTDDTVSINNFADDMQEKMLKHSGIMIDDIWYEGTKLYVDLNIYEKYNFDRGSTASGSLHNNLFQTLYCLPEIEKIEVLLDGERNVYASHFSFGEFDVHR